jgi:hypothetical protein
MDNNNNHNEICKILGTVCAQIRDLHGTSEARARRLGSREDFYTSQELNATLI